MKKHMNIDNVTVTFEDLGMEGSPAVILMHGWGCDHTTVRSISAILESKYRVVSIDLPGHGESTEPSLLPDGRPWGVMEYAQLIEKLSYKLGLSQPSLIGHSFGGRVAIVMASRNVIDKLVLIDSAGIKPKRNLRYYFKVYSFKLSKRLAPMFLGKKKGKRIIDKWRSKSGSEDYNKASEMMRAIMSRSVNQDLKKLLPLIAAPTLLIWGEEDTATPLSDAMIMKKRIPDAGLVSFPGCGHYSFLDNPSQFKAVMESFFKI